LSKLANGYSEKKETGIACAKDGVASSFYQGSCAMRNWRIRLLRMFLGIVWRVYDIDPSGKEWRLPVGLSWEVANIMCNPNWKPTGE